MKKTRVLGLTLALLAVLGGSALAYQGPKHGTFVSWATSSDGPRDADGDLTAGAALQLDPTGTRVVKVATWIVWSCTKPDGTKADFGDETAPTDTSQLRAARMAMYARSAGYRGHPPKWQVTQKGSTFAFRSPSIEGTGRLTSRTTATVTVKLPTLAWSAAPDEEGAPNPHHGCVFSFHGPRARRATYTFRLNFSKSARFPVPPAEGAY